MSRNKKPTKFISSVTHRGITADQYTEGTKYMLWYYIAGHMDKTIGIVQVRGIHEPLTESELRMHIDGVWRDYYKLKEKNDRRT